MIDKVKARIQNWKNKNLSFAGRLLLIMSVLCSLQIYWSSVFLLPASISIEIEGMLRGFLWCHSELKRGKAKVNWVDVCKPRKQGWLGIKSLKV